MLCTSCLTSSYHPLAALLPTLVLHKLAEAGYLLKLVKQVSEEGETPAGTCAPPRPFCLPQRTEWRAWGFSRLLALLFFRETPKHTQEDSDDNPETQRKGHDYWWSPPAVCMWRHPQRQGPEHWDRASDVRPFPAPFRWCLLASRSFAFLPR